MQVSIRGKYCKLEWKRGNSFDCLAVLHDNLRLMVTQSEMIPVGLNVCFKEVHFGLEGTDVDCSHVPVVGVG